MATIPPAADAGWKGYSLAERDRRWNAVRARAAEAGFDCIIVPKGNRIDARYLTQILQAGFVLPTDGRPPIVLTDAGAGNAWIPEVRRLRESDRPVWGPGLAQALLDLGMERARIGVVGLSVGTVTHARAADGVVNYGAYAEVLRRLPNATFEDATDVVGFVRYVKSDEELAALKRATAISEAGIDEMVEVARPGVDEAVLYGRVTGRLMELGSEHYGNARSDWTAHGFALKTGALEGHNPRFTDPPVGRRLQHDTFITNEVSAIWGGMVSQEVQPILLGPIPEQWKAMVELQREVFEAGLAYMKPGLTYREFIDFVVGFSKRDDLKTALTLHGRGMGDDGPLITSRSSNERLRNLTMQAGNAWVWKPVARTADGKAEFQWGGTVALTERGVERYFERKHELVSIV
jgi:Xaa-Pro aminopeptidase